MTARRETRFIVLLTAILVLFMLNPLAEEMEWRMAIILLNGAFTMVFFSAVYAISQNKRQLIISSAMMLPTIVLIWLNPANASKALFTAASGFSLVFFAFITYAIAAYVLSTESVTLEQVAATLCAYLMLGTAWSFAYTLIDIGFPGSFTKTSMHYADYNYFSFVTLTTLGYGDIAPVSKVARAFAIVEAIVGQFFLAVLVARQVGLYLAHRQGN